MRFLRRTQAGGLSAAVATLSLLNAFAANAGEAQVNPLELGRAAFTMNFARPSTTVGDGQLGVRGNGLGPLLNDTSCVNCHNQGGIGGGGENEHNVIMVGIVTRPAPSGSIDSILSAARRVHPGFTDEAPVKVLHRFALADSDKVKGYDQWRDGVLSSFGVDPANPGVIPVQQTVGPVTLELVQRNTPALFGLGAIDRLRQNGGDRVRRDQAEAQFKKTAWITGRLPRTPDHQPGWFGARGQVESLQDFVRGACANEMGLQVSGFDEVALQSIDSAGRPQAKPAKDSRVDLNLQETKALVSFVGSLPKPIVNVPKGHAELMRFDSGRAAFNEFGCADCHVENLGTVKGVYSDFLMHDMGDTYRDVQTATPELRVEKKVTKVRTTSSGRGGYGSTSSLRTLVSTTVREVPTNPEREWKTSPLWGVRDSYPYLHDGRAATLQEAIRLHGGEADRSASRFVSAPVDQQENLIVFLQALQAPPSAEAVGDTFN